MGECTCDRRFQQKPGVWDSLELELQEGVSCRRGLGTKHRSPTKAEQARSCGAPFSSALVPGKQQKQHIMFLSTHRTSLGKFSREQPWKEARLANSFLLQGEWVSSGNVSCPIAADPCSAEALWFVVGSQCSPAGQFKMSYS